MKPMGLQLQRQTGSLKVCSHASFHTWGAFGCYFYWLLAGSLFQTLTLWSSPTVAIISHIRPTLLDHATSRTQSSWAYFYLPSLKLNSLTILNSYVYASSFQMFTFLSIPPDTNRFGLMLILFCAFFYWSICSARSRHGSCAGPHYRLVTPLLCPLSLTGSAQLPKCPWYSSSRILPSEEPAKRQSPYSWGAN